MLVIMDGIVVGLDESMAAADALRWGLRESTLHGLALTAVMVWGYLDQRHLDTTDDFDPCYDDAAAATVLDCLITNAIGSAGAAIGRTAVIDLPGRALVDASMGADLLVVGARGLGGFKGLLLGSVSRHCLHHAACPVAIVRADVAPAAASDAVVVGIDGSDTSVRALQWAVREARARQSPLTIVHSYRHALLGAVEYAAPALRPDLLEAAAHETVQRAVAEVDLTGILEHPRRVVVETGAPAAILDAGRHAGLIVVGSRGLGGVTGFVLGSVSHQVTEHAPCPVVVVPPADRQTSHP